MANILTDTGTQGGFVDKRRGLGLPGNPVATPLNYDSVTGLRARLTAISGTTYTAAVLDAMTVNDMVFAVRTNDDAAGLI